MKILSRVVAVLILITVIFLGWIGMTDSGLRWSFHYAKPYLPATLKLNSIEGHLFGVMHLKGVEYKQDAALFKTSEIIINWSPSALLTSKISVSKLQIESLKIELPQTKKTASKAQNDLPISLPEINLPWRVSINSAVINGLTLQQGSDVFKIDTIKLDASSLFTQLDINELSIQAKTFNLSIKGDINLANDYQHQLETHWAVNLPSGEIVKGKGKLIGDLKKTALTQELSQPIQATLHAEVSNLLSQLQWQAQLKIPQFDSAKFITTAPRIVATLSVEGKGDLNSASLESSLNGQHVNSTRPIDIHTTLQLKKYASGFDITKLELTSEDTQLNLNGRVAEQLKLNWSVSANDLGKLYPQAKGKFQASGSIAGTLKAPKIKATYNGQALSFADYAMASLDGSLSVDLMHWQQLKLKLLAKNIRIKGSHVQELNIKANSQQLTLNAITDTTTAKVVVKGRSNTNGWQGEILQADITNQQFKHWKLKSAVALNINPGMVTVETLCWVNPGDASVCVSLQNQNKHWQANLVLNKFPLNALNLWLPNDINLEGNANATADIQLQMPDQLFAQVKLQLPPGSVFYPVPDGDYEQWKYQGGTVNLILNKQGLSAEAEMTLNQDDKLNIKAALPDMHLLTLDPQQQSMRVEADFNMRNLGFIEAMIPEAQDLKGEMAVKLLVTGTLAQPQINGQADVFNGSLRIPRLGLTISKLKIKGKTDHLKHFDFHLDAHSGDGDIAIEGQTRLDNAAGWPTEIKVKGNEFEVSRIPEARVVVTPDLNIKLQHNTIDVRGKVHIPYAKLQPKDITTAAHVSPDAIIVGEKRIPESKWSIVTRIRLTLGERVNFYGYGFEGRFGGSLLLEDEPGQLSKATGEITVPEGKYQAYGQNLTIQYGRLIYTGGPVTNPGLDLRAVRIVNNITAGLKVKGSLTQPQIELFSIPAMGQTNILSYLLMGAPIETASKEEGSMMAKAALALGLSGGDNLARKLGDQFGLDQMRVESSDNGGQASLVMGRYLSPKLYVSYGVGLVQAFNTFTVRYQLSDKWQIKAQSGEAQGADILYTIER